MNKQKQNKLPKKMLMIFKPKKIMSLKRRKRQKKIKRPIKIIRIKERKRNKQKQNKLPKKMLMFFKPRKIMSLKRRKRQKKIKRPIKKASKEVLMKVTKILIKKVMMKVAKKIIKMCKRLNGRLQSHQIELDREYTFMMKKKTKRVRRKLAKKKIQSNKKCHKKATIINKLLTLLTKIYLYKMENMQMKKEANNNNNLKQLNHKTNQQL